MVDYISDLPDEVIDNILTRLPTREAVQTLLLSKGWAEKWTCITRVRFNDRLSGTFDANGVWMDFPGNIDETRFLAFVYETLLRVRNVFSFSLVLWQDEYEVLNLIGSSIDTAFKSEVQTAVIEHLSNNNTQLRLPSSVLHCRSLEKLYLRQFEAMIPTANEFPCLKRLELTRVVFLNENPEIDTMSITFPVLVQCTISHCSWLNIKVMEMNAPKLIGAHFYTRKDRKPHVDGCTIRITGAKIEEFTVNDGYPANFHFHGSTVRRAEVECEPIEFEVIDTLRTCGLQLRKLLNQLSGLKELALYGNLTEAIAKTKRDILYDQGYEASAEYEYFRRPMCFYLEKLNVSEHLHKEGLVELLGWTPRLKRLNVDLRKDDEKWSIDPAFDRFEMPSCIVSSVEVVEFQFFTGDAKQYDLIQYLIENGAVLTRFVINRRVVQPWEDQTGQDVEMMPEMVMVEKLQSFRRASNLVQIMLDETIVV